MHALFLLPKAFRSQTHKVLCTFTVYKSHSHAIHVLFAKYSISRRPRFSNYHINARTMRCLRQPSKKRMHSSSALAYMHSGQKTWNKNCSTLLPRYRTVNRFKSRSHFTLVFSTVCCRPLQKYRAQCLIYRVSRRYALLVLQKMPATRLSRLLSQNNEKAAVSLRSRSFSL